MLLTSASDMQPMVGHLMCSLASGCGKQPRGRSGCCLTPSNPQVRHKYLRRCKDDSSTSLLHFDATFGLYSSQCSSLSCLMQTLPGSSFNMLAAQAVKYAVTCKGPKGCQHAERHHQRISLSAFRYRCAACKQDFCGQCFATPYHAELTCEEHKAPKCLYCQAPLLEEDSYMDADR